MDVTLVTGNKQEVLFCRIIRTLDGKKKVAGGNKIYGNEDILQGDRIKN